jgi:signal transduction histidine kinase
MNRRVLVALALGGLAVGLYAEWAYAQGGTAPAELVRDVAVGWAFVGAGLVAWRRRPANRLGLLMTAEGFAWFFGNLEGTGIPVLFAIGLWLTWLELAILAHLILAFPSGCLLSRWERLSIGTFYGVVLVIGFMLTATYDPFMYSDCPECTTDFLFVYSNTPNPIQLYNNKAVFENVNQAYQAALAVLSLAILGTVGARWRRSSGPTRRALAPVWFSAAIFAVSGGWLGAEAIGEFSPSTRTVLYWISDIGQLAVPVAFLVALLRMRLARTSVGKLVIEVGQAPPAGKLRDVLAGTLQDPSLQLVFWRPDTQRYVDLEGRPVRLPDQGSQWAVTLMERDGAPLAAMIHDAALADEDELVQAVAAAARLGLENEQLQAQVRAQLEEVRASRARIVEAGDAERRRVEQNLHDGAQQRLVSLSLALRLAQVQLGPNANPRSQASLVQASEELQAALSELRQLARGIHPAILTQQGLGAAVESLAQQAPLPVEVSVACQRYTSAVETAAYFVVSEALTNVAKYAQATAATVTVKQANGWLIVDVTDDGIGGADPARGSGLNGLADRVAALDGVLQVDSPTGRGTRVRAELPCE